MRQRATAIIAAAAAIGLACAWWQARSPLPALAAGTALEPPRDIAAFRLTDHRGGAFTNESLRGRWSLVFTGFTHCPDVCPTTIALFAALRARLPDEALQLLFVSVDPARDTPDRMAAYLAHFGAGLTGATGSDDDIGRFTAGLGLAQVRNPGIAGAYTYDHSAALVLIDPRARVAAYFTPPHDADALAADLAGILGRST
jgi:protein SCO1/2